MKNRHGIILALALCAALPSELAAQQKAGAPRVIALTGTDAMKFTPSQITAKPGEKLRIVLKSVSTMPKAMMAHNFVMLKPGSDYSAFANASAMARPAYIAPKLKDQILAATGLAGGGETVTVDFTAPTKPGKYMFICTFPAHFSGGMTGTLTVK
jgi:azurin